MKKGTVIERLFEAADPHLSLLAVDHLRKFSPQKI
jgi:hypothetical protein